MYKYIAVSSLKEAFLLLILAINFLFITEVEAQGNKSKNSMSLNSTVAIPLMYNDKNFQSSIPVFLTGEFKAKRFSATLGIGFEFGKLEYKGQSEAATLANCPPTIFFPDTTPEIIRCHYCFTRNSINLRFPIAFSYYFLNKKKFQTYLSSGIILDYTFINYGSSGFFEYSTQQMRVLSNELRNEDFSYNDIDYINYDATLQLGGKYALTERWLLNLGLMYSLSFEKFILKYPNNDAKIALISGLSFKII